MDLTAVAAWMGVVGAKRPHPMVFAVLPGALAAVALRRLGRVAAA